MAQRDPWDDFSSAAPAAPASSGRAGETLVPITPGRQPAPQTDAQATSDELRNTRTQQDIEAANREAANAPQQQEFDRLNRVGQLRQEFNQRPDVRQFFEIRNSARALERLGRAGSPQSDIALVFSFMKTLDPGSTVASGEQATARNAAAVPDQVRNYYNQLLTGESLSEAQRQGMVNVARDLYRARAQGYNETAAQYHQLLRDFGEQHPGRQIPVAGGALHEGEQQNRGQVEFWDERGDVPEGAEQFQSDLQEAINRGFFTTPEQIVEYARGRGFTIRPDQAQAAIDARGREGGVTVSRPTFERPDISDMRGEGGALETTDAVIRSTANAMTAGVADRAAALVDTYTRGGTYDENVRRQHAITDYDWREHPYASTAGTLAGGLAIPTGVTTAARAAAVDVLRAGGNRIAALDAARRAAASRLMAEGAAFGGATGYNEGDGDVVDRIADAAVGAAFGGGAGRVLAEGGGAMARAGRRSDGTAPAPADLPPLVDPTTGRLNAPLEEATPAQRMAAGEAAGITLPAGAAGDRTAALLEKGLDILPGSAGVMEDARRGLGNQVDNAVEGLASRYGSATTDYAAGQAAQRGAQRWVSRFEQASGRAYEAIPIAPGRPATIDNTRAALTRMIDVFRSNPEMRAIFQNATLRRYLEALTQPHEVADEFGVRDLQAGVLRTVGRDTTQPPGGLSWQDLKQFRSIIGEQIGAERFSDSPARSQLRGLYAALSDDMRATATAQGARALRAFERANNLYREGQERIDQALVSLLGDDSRNNPERAAQVIRTITRAGRGSSNINQLAQIRASLSKGGEWDDVASYMIRSMGQPANSQGREFNPQTFVQNYADMSESARNLLFGDRGRQELRQALDGFTAVQQRLAGTNALRNTSNTAPGLTAAGTVSSIIAGLLNPVLGVKVAGSMAGAYGGARLWTNPAFVRWATGYTRMLEGAARASRSPDRAVVDRQLNYLARVARSNPSIASEASGLHDEIINAMGGEGSDGGAPPATSGE